MTLPDFLVRDADGHVHLAGHRIGLHDVAHYYNEGGSAEELCEVFPTLPLALVHKVIAFYLEHRAEVDASVAAVEAKMERQRAAAAHGPSLAELRRRLAPKQSAGV
jgi:uncharacterized protein (DUF433 family)